MALNQYTLTEKKSLTADIFELTFEAKESFDFIAGQFVTFIIPKIGWRAYSILQVNGKKIILIIKKRFIKNWWRGGSEFICDLKLWEILSGTKPAGRFVLQNNDKHKLFLGTGTGFVPLYNQILWSLEYNQKCRLKIIFWVKEYKDIFYEQELKILKEKYVNFDFEIYISRERVSWFNHWYVTDFLTKDRVDEYWEFYICWAPGMIDSSVQILIDKKILAEDIFTEKY